MTDMTDTPPDLPGTAAGDADPVGEQPPVDADDAAGEELGIGDGDDVQPGAGAVEPPD